MRALILAVGCLATASSAWAADTRHYDCSKPGNANKAVCRTAAGAVAPPATAPAAVKAARAYDCAKPGNRNKAACKTAAATPAATAAPAARPVSAAPAAPSASIAAAPVPATRSNAATPGAPRIVAWTEKNGKVVHYDCSKAGNATKKACKAP